jgi:hypothetical protein
VFTGADSASLRRLGVALQACLRYIHITRRLDHVLHLEWTVTGTLLVDNAMFATVIICFLCFIFRKSFVVLGCRAWNFLPHNMKRLPMQGCPWEVCFGLEGDVP